MRYAEDNWELEYTDEFGHWWDDLTAAEQLDVGTVVRILVALGPALGFPYSSQVRTSTFGQMRELRIQHAGRPYRVLYAFDSRRVGILLLGGQKTGDDRWYAINVPRADALFRQHLVDLK